MFLQGLAGRWEPTHIVHAVALDASGADNLLGHPSAVASYALWYSLRLHQLLYFFAAPAFVLVQYGHVTLPVVYSEAVVVLRHPVRLVSVPM